MRKLPKWALNRLLTEYAMVSDIVEDLIESNPSIDWSITKLTDLNDKQLRAFYSELQKSTTAKRIKSLKDFENYNFSPNIMSALAVALTLNK